MNNWMIALVAAAALAMTGAAAAQSDAAAGKAKAASCAACHGADGNSSVATYPKLADLGEAYIVRELKAFKSGDRKNALMSPMAQPLSEQDMRDLAAYFSAQTMQPGGADESLVAQGGAIYRGGLLEKGVPACAACHGPAGAGNAVAGYPRIGGQHAVYLASSLAAFKSGQRAAGTAAIMRDIAAKLSDDEIRAVASYASGLYKRD